MPLCIILGLIKFLEERVFRGVGLLRSQPMEYADLALHASWVHQFEPNSMFCLFEVQLESTIRNAGDDTISVMHMLY